ncbi:hypothetical protein PR048_011213, partial [Dryococelus australis]
MSQQVTCKPEVMTFYNIAKGGVDVDEMKASYSVSRISNRLPLAVFFTIMNSYNLQLQHRQIYRCKYINTLSLDLGKPHIVTRASIPTLPGELVSIIKLVSVLHVVDSLPPSAQGFCAICPRDKNWQIKMICA